jgi:hypothetical protein
MSPHLVAVSSLLLLFSCAPPSPEATGSQQAALLTPVVRDFSLAVVLAHLADVNTHPLSPEAVRADVFTGPQSVREFLRAQSYGALTLVGKRNRDGDVLGPFRLSIPDSADCNGRAEAIAAEVRRVALAGGIDLSTYDGLLIQLPSDRCRFGGANTLRETVCWGAECPGAPPPNDFRFVRSSLTFGVTRHGDQTFGCSAAGQRVTLSDQCLLIPGEDPFELSQKFPAPSSLSVSALMRLRLKSLSEAQVMELSQSATVTITPTEVNSQALKLVRVFAGFISFHPHWYYLDFRQPAPVWSLPAGSPAFGGVTVRLASDYHRSHLLLDATPADGTFDDSQLMPGSTFVDPLRGVRFSVLSAGPAGAAVSIVIPPSDALPPGTGNGLLGEYFADAARADRRAVRTDPAIDFNFAAGASPAPSVPDDFTARWTGELLPRVTGPHQLFVHYDDAVRISLNGTLVLVAAAPGDPNPLTRTVNLVSGQKVSLVVEYADTTGAGFLQLGWAARGLPFELIPTSQLFHTPPPITVTPDAGTPPPDTGSGSPADAGGLIESGGGSEPGGGGSSPGRNEVGAPPPVGSSGITAVSAGCSATGSGGLALALVVWWAAIHSRRSKRASRRSAAQGRAARSFN